jgi:hypothetical protein
MNIDLMRQAWKETYPQHIEHPDFKDDCRVWDGIGVILDGIDVILSRYEALAEKPSEAKHKHNWTKWYSVRETNNEFRLCTLHECYASETRSKPSEPEPKIHHVKRVDPVLGFEIWRIDCGGAGSAFRPLIGHFTEEWSSVTCLDCLAKKLEPKPKCTHSRNGIIFVVILDSPINKMKCSDCGAILPIPKK